VYLKNIGDCVPSGDESVGTRLEPPLFWLDNIFKKVPVKEYHSKACTSISTPLVSIFFKHLMTEIHKKTLNDNKREILPFLGNFRQRFCPDANILLYSSLS
jgi:hypothetical protein